MLDDIIYKVVDEVYRERSLYKKICDSGKSCAGCGLCPMHHPDSVIKIFDNGAERISTGPGIKDGAIKISDIAGMIDHTLLKPDATIEQVTVLCEEARMYNFATVCVNPCWVKHSHDLLSGSKVKVCSVIGFPLGTSTTKLKVEETRIAILDGAKEIDMVINIGRLKSKDYNYVFEDINQVALTCKKNNVLLKVIIESCLLSDEEKVIACLLAKDAQADFVKTSTGFSSSGATIGDVALMRKVVGSAIGVKAAGGIKTYEDAQSMIDSGADRIGASASIKIVTSNK